MSVLTLKLCIALPESELSDSIPRPSISMNEKSLWWYADNVSEENPERGKKPESGIVCENTEAGRRRGATG